MALSYTELMKLENPYLRLNTHDALVENLSVLNELSEEDKETLATRIIESCPESEFTHYSHTLEVLRNVTNDAGTFYPVIMEAYRFKQSLLDLLKPENTCPHSLFLAPKFTPELFHRFRNLSDPVLKNKETLIAERLALCAPPEACGQVAYNVSTAFPESTLATRTGAAFTLRHNINAYLLKGNPEDFFKSPDFNPDIFNMFSNMLRTLLKDHEKEIGMKLGTIKSSETRKSIARQLALLPSEVADSRNPFKLIADAMKEKESELQARARPNPNSFFAFEESTHLSPDTQEERFQFAST